MNTMTETVGIAKRAAGDLAEHLVRGPMMTRPVIVSGSGSHVVDDEGKGYLDLEAAPA